ncbi:hypothetical protein AMECASPLE_031427 [Ameca splendens]|uniref:Uncharacterized protein n=1 Tax=Ameca splendens TaxID=208324 RepID=A0ABV0Z4K0_9TELE
MQENNCGSPVCSTYLCRYYSPAGECVPQAKGDAVLCSELQHKGNCIAKQQSSVQSFLPSAFPSFNSE